MIQEKPKRRWYQFSLRTMFVAVTLACIAMAFAVRWVQHSREWIRQRDGALGENFVQRTLPDKESDRPLAPSGLWLLGAKGEPEIECPPEKRERMQRLFPEARVWVLASDKPAD
jgi:hypothetical protein